MDEKIVSRMKEEVLNTPLKSASVSLNFWFNKENSKIHVDHGPCAYNMGNKYGGFVAYGAMPHWKKSVSEENARLFAKFCVEDDRSPFMPLIKAAGEHFHIIYDKDNNVHGWIMTDPKAVNFRYMFNMAKGFRLLTEHSKKFSFWEKWALKEKKHPGLVYVLSYFFDHMGKKINTNHSGLDTYGKNKIDVSRCLGVIPSDVKNKVNGYRGEMDTSWFNLKRDNAVVLDLKDIVCLDKDKKLYEKTILCKKYFAAPESSDRRDQDFEYFFNNYEKILNVNNT